MSLEAYNKLISNMLNSWQALAKIKSELEGREGQKCWRYKQFSYLAKNYRSKEGKAEEEIKKIEKHFEVLSSRVIQYRVREIRRMEQREEEKEEVQYFRCWGKEHYVMKRQAN